MTQREKRLAAMKRNPQADWQLADIQTIALQYGFDWRQPGSSHCTIRRPDGAILTVPARRPIKPIYVTKFIAFVEEWDGKNE